MKDTATPRTILLKDYEKPDYLINDIHLTFDLHNTQTKVTSVMNMVCNHEVENGQNPLILNGEELTLKSIKLNGRQLEEGEYELKEETLQITDLPKEFSLEIENEINPEANKALDGLYKSGSMFCTQNEPEGFRRITYYLDRPDVMAKFTTKIIADKNEYPILLSNGNPIGKGDLEGGRHWVEWEDPFLKPAYLYALVAGNLGLIQDKYTTCSGREIDLRIYCELGDEDKCGHAMESLKKSMKWDEDTYGLEYDLDIYMIVAADSFNMGAMENKGLNIFNSSLLLAKPETATDHDFFDIEAVIAHEYFHNWTGNRITCRDWFQLTLKEGLTVFRDQRFSSDMNGDAVNRIDIVKGLRGHQFVEDAGPTAHPIKPESYMEINNFYTSTIYDKGAEVIRMLQTFLGVDGFRKGMDKYFELFDGQAVTTEDFLHAMSVANNNFDMTQFKNWYSQAGTPKVMAKAGYDEKKEVLTLKLSQSCEPTPGQKEKKPFHMPLELGLIGSNGEDLPLNLSQSDLEQPQVEKGLIHLRQEEENYVFSGVKEKPYLSLNRKFSAPIRLETSNTLEDLAFLMAHDSDEFNRFEAAQVLAETLLHGLIEDVQKGRELVLDPRYKEAYGKLLEDSKIDDSFKGLCLGLPAEGILHQTQNPIDFEATHTAREFMVKSLALEFKDKFEALYQEKNIIKPYSFNPKDMGERSLKARALSFLMTLEEKSYDQLAFSQFKSANNMTDQLNALGCLRDRDCSERKEALEAFYNQWREDKLVMQKWLAIQASANLESTYELVLELTKHEVYDKAVPNLVRSLIGTFANNHMQLHHISGRGYQFIADSILDLDKINPQMASRLAGAFKHYKRLQQENKELVGKHLKRIKDTEGLSKNTFEIISKTLGE